MAAAEAVHAGAGAAPMERSSAAAVAATEHMSKAEAMMALEVPCCRTDS